MPEQIPTLLVPSLGGGLNTGVASDKIDDDEMSRLINFYPDGPSIKRRGGTRRITVNKYDPTGNDDPQALTSFHRFVGGTGIWALVVGATESVAVLDAGGQNLRLLSESNQFIESFVPWVWAQYKDVVYGFRTGPGMIRVQVTPAERVSTPGMDAPTTGPILGAGDAGQIPAANFQGISTCYNSITGAESNPSPASPVYAHAGGTKIRWTSIDLCPPDQANARKLYRTLPNQTGAYYLVTTINDNVTDSYSEDNLLVAGLGAVASTKNGKPPVNLLMGVIWRDRLFASDGVNVYWSQVGLPESFSSSDAIAVSPDDGHLITGLHADEDRLYIQKTNSIHYLTGSDRGTYELHTMDTEHGGWSHHSMVSAGGRLYWLGWDDIYASTGGPGQSISHPRMRRYLDMMDRDKMYLSHTAVVSDKELLLVTAPLRDGIDFDNERCVTLAYNYKSDAWSIWGVPQDSHAIEGTTLNFMQGTFDRFDEPVLWALFSYNLYTHDDPVWPYDEASSSAQRNFPQPINAIARTKSLVSSPGFGIIMRRLKLLGDPVDANVTLRVYLNGDEDTAVKTRTVSLAGIDDWRAFNMSTAGRPASQVAIELEYEGVPQAEFRSIALELAKVPRSRRAI